MNDPLITLRVNKKIKSKIDKIPKGIRSYIIRKTIDKYVLSVAKEVLDGNDNDDNTDATVEMY